MGSRSILYGLVFQYKFPGEDVPETWQQFLLLRIRYSPYIPGSPLLLPDRLLQIPSLSRTDVKKKSSRRKKREYRSCNLLMEAIRSFPQFRLSWKGQDNSRTASSHRKGHSLHESAARRKSWALRKYFRNLFYLRNVRYPLWESISDQTTLPDKLISAGSIPLVCIFCTGQNLSIFHRERISRGAWSL